MNLRQAPLLLLALLLASGGVLSAQEDAGHRAEPPSAPDPAPVETPTPDVTETPSAEPPDTPVESPSEAPSEPSSDSPSRRYAVPVDTPVEPHRQPPRGGHGNPDPPSGGGDGDGYVPEDPIEVESDYDEPYDAPASAGGWFGRRFGGLDEGGALDLDVSPGRTQVYLDGEYVGIVDRYDGWPGYLRLEEGTYEIVFYLDGFRTVARRVTVRPGMVIVLDDRLKPGPSIRPEEFAPRR